MMCIATKPQRQEITKSNLEDVAQPWYESNPTDLEDPAYGALNDLIDQMIPSCPHEDWALATSALLGDDPKVPTGHMSAALFHAAALNIAIGVYEALTQQHLPDEYWHQATEVSERLRELKDELTDEFCNSPFCK